MLHYEDIPLTLYYGNKVSVPVMLTHTAITRLMRVEAEQYFRAEEGSKRYEDLRRLKQNVFRAVEEGPNPSFLCQSVDDCLRVSAVQFSRQPKQ